jgi:tetratricopeptide (TPR) repeat protein
MKRANKFLLGSILDYQMDAQRAWDNAERFAEQELRDPEQLWQTIVTQFPDANAFAKDEQHKWLHRYPQARMRVARIAGDLVRQHEGDARRIWRGQPSPEVLARLRGIGAGEHISRRTVGALMDTGQIPTETTDLPGDIHVRRVLGRCILGREVEADEAIKLGRQLHPENPWALNELLYDVSVRHCRKQSPACEYCRLRVDCALGGGALSDEERVDLCTDSAYDFLEKGQYEAAVAFASRATQLAPQKSLPHGLRALGDHRRAEADAKKLVALAPDDPEVYYCSGIVHERSGKHVEAARDFTRAIELKQGDAEAEHYEACGHALQAAGRHAEAVKDFTCAIRLARRSAPAEFFRGRAASLRALGREVEARHDEMSARRRETGEIS